MAFKRLVILAACLLAASGVSAKNLRWASQGDISTQDPHANNESFNNNRASRSTSC
jgi:hypothetical protein